jgi:hypothetical protein
MDWRINTTDCRIAVIVGAPITVIAARSFLAQTFSVDACVIDRTRIPVIALITFTEHTAAAFFAALVYKLVAIVIDLVTANIPCSRINIRVIIVTVSDHVKTIPIDIQWKALW